ncbi:MAG: hypothetical protein H6724_10665 [Sandaracinus sp.]|nr:hypothetical protein [Sandaracinus sp.]MCB9619895.1 hypothetical protein [Sandaracinus sp.]
MKRPARHALVLGLALVLGACGDDDATEDASVVDATTDARSTDATTDAPVRDDGGSTGRRSLTGGLTPSTTQASTSRFQLRGHLAPALAPRQSRGGRLTLRHDRIAQ